MHGHENHRGGSRPSDRERGGAFMQILRYEGPRSQTKFGLKIKGGSSGSAIESYRIGLLFTLNNGCGGAISVME